MPPHLAADVRVGTIVRVDLHGRRVGGWVMALRDSAGQRRALKSIAKVTGRGPSADLVDLARWATWRWAGREASFLKTASPPRAVRSLPATPSQHAGPTWSRDGGSAPACVVVRTPPAGDRWPLVQEVASYADALVLVPSQAQAARMAERLRREGLATALMPSDWPRAAAGGCVAVGSRAAAWAPRPRLGAVLVLDEHDEVYQEERAPTWHARDVVIERARRGGARCWLASPCPTLEALAAGELSPPRRADERAGWPPLEVVDRRKEPPGLGLFSERLVSALRAAPRAVCVLNRKGRARLLACNSCGELARCEACGAAVGQPSGSVALQCRRCGVERPAVCLVCGATRLKVLRIGVGRAAEELGLLLRRPVAEVSGERSDSRLPDAPVLVGTEAVLHRADAGRRPDLVAFLDLDQELLAPRYRAAEQALALLARAARLLGGRARGGRLLVQTRIPDHEVVQAALLADPDRSSAAELARRDALRFPPAAALAEVSGSSAQTFVLALPAGDSIEVMGPAGGRYLLRALDHRALCDALAVARAAPRPPGGRLRVSVDPLRL